MAEEDWKVAAVAQRGAPAGTGAVEQVAATVAQKEAAAARSAATAGTVAALARVAQKEATEGTR